MPAPALPRGSDHSITDWFGWERTYQGHPAQPPAMGRDIFNRIRVLRAPSNLAWNGSRDGASPTALGNLGQPLTTLTVKNFFLTSRLDLPSFSLKPPPLVLSLQTLLRSLSPSFLQAPLSMLLSTEHNTGARINLPNTVPSRVPCRAGRAWPVCRLRWLRTLLSLPTRLQLLGANLPVPIAVASLPPGEGSPVPRQTPARPAARKGLQQESFRQGQHTPGKLRSTVLGSPGQER